MRMTHDVEFPTDPDDLDGWLEDRTAQLAALMDRAMQTIIDEAIASFDPHALVAAAGDLASFDAMRGQWQTLIDDELIPVLGQVYTGAGLSAILTSHVPEQGSSVLADVVNESAVDYTRTATNRIVGAGDNLWRTVRSQLTDAVNSGASTEDLKGTIERVTGYSEFRSDTIARTEVMMAYNHGDNDTARHLGEYGPVEKQWLATMDARTRPSHSDADGQTVPFDTDFTVGGVSMPFPGEGPAEETVNCRCTTLHLYRGDTRYDGTTVGDEPLGDVPQGPVTPDAVLADWIKSRLDADPNASAAQLIREWKALGNKVNDKRFRDIMGNVKEGNTNLRSVKVKPEPVAPIEQKMERTSGLGGRLTDEQRRTITFAREQVTGYADKGYHASNGRFVINDRGIAANRAVIDAGRVVENRVAELVGHDYDELVTKLNRLPAYSKEQTALREEFAGAIRQSLGEMRDMGGPIDVYGDSAGAVRAVRQATENYPAQWLAEVRVHEVKMVSRGYYNGYQRVIALSRGGETTFGRESLYRVATHELGHAVEGVNDSIRQAEHLFYWERAEAPNWIGDRFSQWKRAADEWGYDDRWYNKYAGRNYGGAEYSPYEVLTMGVEQLLGGAPLESFSGAPLMDADHARWLMGVLAAL